MNSAIAPSGGFRKMFSFGYTCLVYHATTAFCKRVYSWKDDPLGKTSGQMIGAARSARQNIVEASARAGTSKETELKLLDVAKGSLAELEGDYEAFANAAAANGRNVWECYVAGLDPTNAASEFTAAISISNDVPYIIWSPNLNTNGIVRKYTILGKGSLTDTADWAPTNSAHRFFKVKVEMP